MKKPKATSLLMGGTSISCLGRISPDRDLHHVASMFSKVISKPIFRILLEWISIDYNVHLYEEEGLLCPDECCHHGGLHPGLLPGHAGGCAVLAVSKS